jgi:hypothetical protein
VPIPTWVVAGGSTTNDEAKAIPCLRLSFFRSSSIDACIYLPPASTLGKVAVRSATTASVYTYRLDSKEFRLTLLFSRGTLSRLSCHTRHVDWPIHNCLHAGRVQRKFHSHSWTNSEITRISCNACVYMCQARSSPLQSESFGPPTSTAQHPPTVLLLIPKRHPCPNARLWNRTFSS